MAKKYYKGFGTMSQPVSQDGLNIEIDMGPLDALEEFLRLVQSGTAKDIPYILEDVIHEIGLFAEGYILRLIEDAPLDNKYKQFMLSRTQVKVENWGSRCVIVVSGKTEDQLGSGGKGGSYNIWAVQEFGYSFPEIRPKNPDAQGYGRFNFQKDAGGIIARMKVIPARTISKNKGKIQRLINSHDTQIRQQIALSGDSIVRRHMQNVIQRSVKAAGLQEIRGAQEHKDFLAQKGYTPQALTGAGIKQVQTLSTGQTVFRGAKGQFVSQKLGGTASITTLGK